MTSTSALFTNLHCDFYKCAVHKSPLRLLQVHRSLISTATSTSAPFINLHCCLATVAPCCNESSFISDYSVWLCYPTIKWLCDYATHQQSCYRCEYALTTIYQHRRNLSSCSYPEHVTTCRCIYSTLVIQLHQLTGSESTFAVSQLNSLRSTPFDSVLLHFRVFISAFVS